MRLAVAVAPLLLTCTLAHAETSAPRMAPAVEKGIIVQGGKTAADGPMGDCNDPVAIGPKQDDPRAVVAGNSGMAAIGPKQDDPRAMAGSSTGMVAIGPKQDDPRARTAAGTKCKKDKR